MTNQEKIDFITQLCESPTFEANQYQIDALRTATTELDNQELLAEALIGLCGEVGEIADLYKKHKYQGHNFDREAAISELGDVTWYIALAATALRIPLSVVMDRNIHKLLARYPNGFNSNDSINRKV